MSDKSFKPGELTEAQEWQLTVESVRNSRWPNPKRPELAAWLRLLGAATIAAAVAFGAVYLVSATKPPPSAMEFRPH